MPSIETTLIANSILKIEEIKSCDIKIIPDPEKKQDKETQTDHVVGLTTNDYIGVCVIC
jgi:hypothetical protein